MLARDLSCLVSSGPVICVSDSRLEDGALDVLEFTPNGEDFEASHLVVGSSMQTGQEFRETKQLGTGRLARSEK